MTDSINQLLEDMKTDANICRLIHRVDQARALKYYSDRLEALIGESEVDVIAMRTEISAQQEVITRLEARIKDYQAACEQKQEIINGYS